MSGRSLLFVVAAAAVAVAAVAVVVAAVRGFRLLA